MFALALLVVWCMSKERRELPGKTVEQESMAQNRSSAVMQQRKEAHNSLDDFPTPPWATRAVIEYLRRIHEGPLSRLTARDPCANRGHMVRPMLESFGQVYASDVHDYGARFAQLDFLFPGEIPLVDWTFINPPFRLAEQFIRRALETSKIGVVCIARTSFLEGIDRVENLFLDARPAFVLQFAERVVMLRGRLVQSLAPDPMNGNKRATSATSYCAVIWLKDIDLCDITTFDWIPKCRTDLERPGDYPDPVDGLAVLERQASL